MMIGNVKCPTVLKNKRTLWLIKLKNVKNSVFLLPANFSHTEDSWEEVLT